MPVAKIIVQFEEYPRGAFVINRNVSKLEDLKLKSQAPPYPEFLREYPIEHRGLEHCLYRVNET
jgi:hypothetical protein